MPSTTRPDHVICRHIATAKWNLRKARHFDRFQPTTGQSAVRGYAKLAGEYAAYAGIPYICFLVAEPDALAVDAIWQAFRAAWEATTELLESVDALG